MGPGLRPGGVRGGAPCAQRTAASGFVQLGWRTLGEVMLSETEANLLPPRHHVVTPHNQQVAITVPALRLESRGSVRAVGE